MPKQLYKRGRIWWGRTQKGGQDKAFSLGTTNYGEAQRRLRIKLDELDATNWGEKPRRKFDEAVDKFMAEHFPHLKPTTATRYATSLAWWADSLEGKYLDEIGSGELYEFEMRRRNAGVTPSTLMKDYTALSSLFSCAEEWEWINRNPVRPYLHNRKRTGLKESEPRTRYLLHPEEDSLLNAVRSRRIWEMIVFAIDTGLRRSEQFALTKANIDLSRNRIIVTPDMAKNRKRRTVPLLPRAREIVVRRMANMHSPFIFATETGGPYSPRSPYIWEELQKAARRAGIDPLRWHDLRRTCGCRLLQDHGMTMKEVCDWLGHSSVLVTERIYAFLGEDALQKALDRAVQSQGQENVVAMKPASKNKGIAS